MKKRKNYWRKIASLIILVVLSIISAPKNSWADDWVPHETKKEPASKSPAITIFDYEGNHLFGRKIDPTLNGATIVPLRYIGNDSGIKGRPGHPNGDTEVLKGWISPQNGYADPGTVFRTNNMGSYNGKTIAVEITVNKRQVSPVFGSSSISINHIRFYDDYVDVDIKPVYPDGSPIIPNEGEELYFILGNTSVGAYEYRPTGRQSILTTESKNGTTGIENVAIFSENSDTKIYDNFTAKYTKDKGYQFYEDIQIPSTYYTYIFKNDPQGINFNFDVKNVDPNLGSYALNLFSSHSLVALKLLNDTPIVVDTHNKKNDKVFIQVNQQINVQGFDHYYPEDFNIKIKTNDLIQTKDNVEDNIKIVDLFGKDHTKNAEITSDNNGDINIFISKNNMKEIVKDIGTKTIQIQGEFPIDYLDPRMEDYEKGKDEGVYEFKVEAENTDRPGKVNQGTATFDPGGPLGKGIPQVVNVGTSTDDLDATKLVTDLFSPYGVDDAEVAVDNGKGGFSKKTTFKTSDNEVQVELRSKKYPNKKNLVSVPIKVEEVVFDIEDNFLLGSGETYLKTDKEITKLVNDNMKFSAKTKTGEKIDDVEVYKTDIPNNDVGKFDVYVRAFHNGHYVEEKKKVSVVGARLKERVFLDQKGSGGFSVEAAADFYYHIRNANFVFDKFNNELGENSASSWTIKWSDKDGNVFPKEELNYGLGSDNYKKKSVPAERNYPKEISPGINTVYLNLRRGKESFDTTMPITFFKESPDFRQINEEMAIKINGMQPFVYLTGSEIRRKQKEEIDEILKNRISFEYWDLKTGKQDTEKTNKIQFKTTNIKDEKSRGTFDIIVAIDGEEFKIPNSVVILPTDPNLSSEEISQYESVNYQTADQSVVLTNPFNNSHIGFPNRGMRNGPTSIGIRYTDRFGFGPSGENREQAIIPGIDLGKRPPTTKGVPVALYNNNNLETFRWGYYEPILVNRINKDFEQDDTFDAIYYLKKNDKIMQIIVDNNHDVLYTHEASLTRNFNSLISFKMYNLTTNPRNMVLLEGTDVFYYAESADIYPTGMHSGMTYTRSYANYSSYLSEDERNSIKKNNEGEYPPQKISEKWKNYKNEYLGDYKKYTASNGRGVSLGGPIWNSNLGYFVYGDNLDKPGQEEDPSYMYPNSNGFYKRLNPSGAENKANSSVSTNIQSVGFDNYLEGAVETFAGTELPLIESKISPTKESIYPEDYKEGNYAFDYTFSVIPNNAKLNIDFTYPNGKKDSKKEVSPTKAIYKDKHVVNKDWITVQQNNPPATIDNYDIDVMATAVGGEYPGITSQENFFRLEVLNLGVEPKIQYVKQNGAFSKTAKEVVDHENAVIKPGKDGKIKPKYIYWDMDENKELTVSQVREKYIKPEELGNKKIFVKMIDENATTDKKEKSVIVEVPVIVGTDNNPKGLYVTANSPIGLRYDEVKDLFNDDLYKLVIDKSHAKGYNVATGLSSGVEVRVNPDSSKTTLNEATLVEGGVYQVTIDAYDDNPDTSNNTPAVVEVRITGNLTANPVHQTIPIGKKLSEDEIKDFVKDVKSGDTPLAKDEYSVTLESKLPDVVSKNDTETVKVKVFEKVSPSKYEEVDVPITMTWGNSIAFGGDETGGRMGGGAYALHNDGTSGDAYISAVSGKIVSNDNEAIAKNHGDDYLSIGWYDLSQSGSTYVMSKDTQPSAPAVTAKGTDKKQDTLNKWGTNTVQAVKTGDLVRGWSTEASKQYMSDKENTTPKALNDKQNDVFYEVTTKGYRRLQFNRYDIIEDNLVAPYSSADELAKNNKLLNDKAKAGEFVALRKLETGETPQAKILGFKDGHYPDLSQPTDKADGIIVIEETLSTSNKKIQYEVPVSFKILDGTLSFKSATDLSFGEHDLPRSDLYFAPQEKENKVVVEDTRHLRKPWELKARMDEPLHYVAGTTKKPLEGSSIIMFNPFSGKDNPLSSSPTVVKKVENSSLSNEIVWNNEVNEGYRLFVRKGSASDRKQYKSEIIYSIDDAPTTRAAGKK